MRCVPLLYRLFFRTRVTDTGCYEWTGSDSGKGKGGGYGRISYHGHTAAVHIVAFEAFKRRLRPGEQVDHKCRNRRCWRPDHLQAVFNSTNQKLRYAFYRRNNAR